MIFISSDRAYAAAYIRLLVTLVVHITVSDIWPVFCWKTHICLTPRYSTCNV